MKFWGKKAKDKTDENRKSIHIADRVASSIFQEILKDNGIPFICRQPGAGGYIKIVTGGLFTTDEIILNESDFEEAQSLYDAYFTAEAVEDEEE